MKMYKVTYWDSLNRRLDYMFEFGRTIDEVKWVVRRRIKGTIVSIRDWKVKGAI